MPIDDALGDLEVPEKSKEFFPLDIDIKFLKELDEKLHYRTRSDHPDYGYIEWDEFTVENMSEKDIYKILNIAEIQELIILPANFGLDAKLGFKVMWDKTPDIVDLFKIGAERMETVLTFRHDQIPETAVFVHVMFDYINSRKNLKLIEKYGFSKPPTDPEDYEY
jgi:hypothetical protein